MANQKMANHHWFVSIETPKQSRDRISQSQESKSICELPMNTVVQLRPSRPEKPTVQGGRARNADYRQRERPPSESKSEG
jgi:hypothetical protein